MKGIFKNVYSVINIPYSTKKNNWEVPFFVVDKVEGEGYIDLGEHELGGIKYRLWETKFGEKRAHYAVKV